MSGNIERQAERLRTIVTDKFRQWADDPDTFHREHPDIIIAVECSGRTQTGAMQSIAHYYTYGTGFDYHIAEVVCGEPIFFIGQYDERSKFEALRTVARQQ